MSIRARLDQATQAKPLLEHPFYVAWAAGTLTQEDLSFYAGQYWRQVEAFPGYLESIADRLPEGVAKDAVLANLADERDDDHPGLWLDFAAALGRDKAETASAAIESETASCVADFTAAANTASTAFAMGMLYGYESQTPKVAETKIAGLRDFYGIEGSGAKYFELHGTLDIEHSAEMAAAIEEIAVDDDATADAAAGAKAGAEAIWRLLDGVARARGIC
ncbi:MAG: pyrroloquinoline-quinone synthase [Actinomycetota bacterium]|jgi:pyrroloquinoline-quinone synthase|nr:pyrroloquinoline-quinone synthase [Actinomycetota bacterium]